MEDQILRLKLMQELVEKLESDKAYYVDLLDGTYTQLAEAKLKIKELETTIEKLMYSF